MSRLWIRLFAGVLLGGSSSIVVADTLRLHNGGTVKGQILDDKSTDEFVVVKSLSGAQVKVERSRILEIVREKSAIEEYEEIKGTFAETAEDQFQLAMWCEQHKLFRQRKEHLGRAIELDPDYTQAREKLGYVKQGGKWLTPQQAKEAQGLVRYNGRYVTPQEREILEQKKREDSEIREWHAKVKMWKGWLVSNDVAKSRQGEENLLAIDDPRAIDALLAHFGKDNDESHRMLMCEVIGNLPGEEATLELVKRSIVDVSPGVRGTAVDELVEREDPAAVRTLIKVLTSEHNTVVRRAAEALGAIGDPTAVPALIDALVTKHKQITVREGGTAFLGTSTPTVIDYEPVVAPGAVAFQPVIGWQQNGIGISSPVREVVVVPVKNEEVRQALEDITEEDFGYDQAAWRHWLAAQKRKEDLRNRR